MIRFLLFFVLTGFLLAEIPSTISWQGVLTDENGNLLNGNYQITTKLYDSETASTALWSETQTIAIADGLANLTLGEDVSFDTIHFNEPLWLEITIGSGTPLTRIKFTAVPYAITAKNVEDESITYDKLQNATGASGTLLKWNGSEWTEAAETDPVFGASASSGIAGADITNWNEAFGWGDHSEAGYITSYTETDPVFGASASSGIAGADITNWNEAFGWGDHSEAGYLTEFDEEDPTWSGDANSSSTIYREGSLGLGTTSPTALLHTSGTDIGEGNVLFVGSAKTSDPGDPPASGGGTRMMWYPDKAAFRVGYVSGTQWNKSNIGTFSFASGNRTFASGTNSTAMGFGTEATGENSTSLGNYTEATGENSIAIGYLSDAIGDHSTALGVSSTASGTASLATGYLTESKGTYSTAMGYDTYSYGSYSIALGKKTTTLGYSSFAMGEETKAKSYGETVLGLYSTDYTTYNYSTWYGNDRIFVVGNGEDEDNKSNAITILKSGNTGLGTDTPNALLHTSGTGTGEGNILFEGEYKFSDPGDPPAEGLGTRMMWYPDKVAFRVGFVNNNIWDKENIGYFSFASGQNTEASGDKSIAMGAFSKASKDNSVSIGSNCYSSGLGSFSGAVNSSASGDYSVALGYQVEAHDDYSHAFGSQNDAYGEYSMTLGYGTITKSYAETALGLYNTSYTPNSTTEWNENDRLLVIGNGKDWDDESNALTILKSGKTGIGTDSPSELLHLYSDANTKLRIAAGSSNIAEVNFFSETTYKGAIGFNNTSDYLYIYQDGNYYFKDGKLGFYNVSSPEYALDLPNYNISKGKGRAYAWIIYSDGRLKSNREKLSYGLNEIMQIEPVQYFHHFSQKDESGILEILNEGNNDFGFIAQDMYKIIPEMVSKPEDDANELWGINYEKLVPVLVKGMQEQQEIIDEQNKKIEILETQNKKIEELENRLKELEKLIK
jgi:hypothetical protein